MIRVVTGARFSLGSSSQKDKCFLCEQSIEQDKSVRDLKALLIAHLNHEIRTPLTAILGFSELLLLQNVAKKKVREDYYGYVVRSCHQLLSSFEHVQELCELESNLRPLDKGVVDLQILAFEVSFQYQNLTPPRVRLEVCSACESLRVLSDTYLIKRLYVHLLDNAIRCTHKGYIILSYYYLEEPALLNICVSDTGSGISLQNQERIFNPFEKTDAYSSGFGLGLTICKTIAQRLGGRIQIDSELNQGSLFVVSIPCDRVN